MFKFQGNFKLTERQTALPAEKKGLHPRNPHRFHYDFDKLMTSHPVLSEYVFINKYNNQSIDFSNPAAVKALNKALLKLFYGISYWDIPPHYLCPPIPGRADYIHYMADLLSTCNDGIPPRGPTVRVLDIGVGANCVYPMIGHHEYGWHFVGTDIDPQAIESANNIIASNDTLQGAVECRHQATPLAIYKNILKPEDVFDLSICNPPFHTSPEDARAGTARKWKNLGIKKGSETRLNFGGKNNELWCKGGELSMVQRMIAESATLPDTCLWYSTLISKQSNLPDVYRALNKAQVFETRTFDMAQGQKISRIVAWTFLNQTQQKAWQIKRWKNPS